MTTGLKIWRMTVQPMLNAIDSFMEEKRLRKSFAHPVLGGGRDSFRYYEKGRWTTVAAEMMPGSTEIDKVIYRDWPMKWSDTGESLTEAERGKVFQVVSEYFDRKKIRWKFSD
jgi:hypothetical protein